MSGRRADPSHFDARAEEARRSGRYDWRSGAARIDPALRGPYEHLERWVRANAPGKLLLDYGCGQGVHSIAPAVSGGRVVGLDLSASALALARERASRAGVPDRVRFVRGDATALPFPAATFEHAIAVDVLSYVEPAVAFSEIARVLRPDGTLVMIDTLGHDPLLRLYRGWRARRGERTSQEVRYIPRVEDIAVAHDHFAYIETAYYDLVTPLAALLGPQSGVGISLARAFAAIDRWLLHLPALQPLALKFVSVLSRPRTGTAR